ncbi:MAG TPA: pitrilysin family protein [Xanthobacteraceae bacterium]|jgi:zinc protease|nr:pitrilysin family protein [Xanthobacteraceae bacterium]
MIASVSFRSAIRRAAIALALPGALLAITPSADATTIERVVSDSGVEAWLVHEPALPLIAVDFAFKGGAVQDPAGKSGTAYLAASLLDDGAGDLDFRAYHDRLERKAIELSFSADRDTLRGAMRTLTENRDEAFDLLRMALTSARFDAANVELNRAQILSQLRRQTTSPGDIANRRWWETAFQGHPYGRAVNGSLETVPNISIDDLKAYTHRVLARSNLKLAVVGDIDAATLKQLLDHVFGALPRDPELTPVENVVPQGLGKRVMVNLDVPQAVVDFGGPGIPRKDPDFMAAYIVNHILGGGSADSRLYHEVREKRGLVYSVADSLVWLDHTALFLGGTATRAERTGETVDLIEKEIHRLAEGGPTDAELTEAKNYLNSSFVLNLDTSTKIASMLVQLQLDNLGTDYFSKRPAMIGAVTLDDAKRVAKRLLDNGMLVTVVGKPTGVASTTAN